MSASGNYGRFNARYTKSGNRSSGYRGGRHPAGEVHPAVGPCTAVLMRHDSVLDPDWMCVAWSPWAELRAVSDVVGAGLYRIADERHRLLYIGESSSVASRIGSHARRDREAAPPVISVAAISTAPAKYQLHELECDLIAGHFDALGTVPMFQFLDGRTADGT